MTNLKLVEGKLSKLYNTFEDYEFDTCIGTNTRLMGVIALQLSWCSKDNPNEVLYQIMHLDFSEYGIDEYKEFNFKRSEYSKRSEMREYWKSVSSPLGGDETELPYFAALFFIESAISINENHYRNHPNHIKIFRKNTLLRIHLMKEATKELIEKSKTLDNDYSKKDFLNLVIPKRLTRFETINYFIMRLVDHDFEAASLLSDLTIDELSDFAIAKKDLLQVIRNKIKYIKTANSDDDIKCYSCKTVLMGESSYYFSMLSVYVTRKNPKVIKVIQEHLQTLTEYEVAIQLRQSEYITVFNVNGISDDVNTDRASFLSKYIPASSTLTPVPNGILYSHYNSDNSHVDTDNYYIGHDLFGVYLLSLSDELVLMSTKLMNITVMETEIINSLLFGSLDLNGRYKFDTQVFQTLCEIPGALFEEMVYHPEDDDE